MKDGSAEKSTHLDLDGSSLCWNVYATNQTSLRESILANISQGSHLVMPSSLSLNTYS